MPRHPDLSPTLRGIGGSVFSQLAGRLASHPGEVYPLHVGDTWMEPAPGARMEDITVEEHPGMHRYSSPKGLPELRERLAARDAERTGLDTRRGSILVTAGATGALGAAVGAIVSPGEEVLILAPHWPLIAGIVSSFHGMPQAVPFFGQVASPMDAVEILDRSAGPKAVALYLNTPNNPTGEVIPRPWLEAIVEWARERELWILADEVYEDIVFEGEHTWTRALAPERVFAAHSFSKAYGMAGNRCGWMAGPEERMGDLRKVSIHTFYSTPTASQLAALRVLGPAGDAWLAEARRLYAEAGRRAAQRLGVEPPAGSTFLFLDVADALGEDGLLGFLERCADRGLFLAPGPSFGPYPTSVRLCFTSAPPEAVERGVSVLAELLSSAGSSGS